MTTNTKKNSNDIDVQKFIEILPRLIRENDTVKGAIITALSGVVATKDDIKALIAEMDKRFEAVDKRFEAVDKRFEAMDRRFEALQREMDRRFEALQREMDRRFDQTDRQIKLLGVSVDRLEGKQGILMERTVLDLMRETLKMEHIDPDKVKKAFIVDRTGAVFWKDYSSDIDVLVENGNVYALEIKAKASHADVTRFIQHIRLYELMEMKKVTKSFVISLRIDPDIKTYAESKGIVVIVGEIST
jgi:hypothetical protein